MPIVVTTEWLREFVPTKLPAEEIADKLSDVGLAVDAFEKIEGPDGSTPDGSTNEARLELEAPTNRGDCWSVLGVARELAAALGVKVKLPKMKLRTSGAPASESVEVRLEAPDLCPRYTARVIRGVEVGPSPEWMQRRLEAVGIRPISNVVDVTNYVLMEMGQPLHAFDMALLAGDKVTTIVVRRARDKEKLPLLDETTRELDTDDLVIADTDRAVAVAGVMGGADTEIRSTTKDVLLESAQFNQISTRRTSRRHGAVTESSIRFEHGVDPVGVELASRRAAYLLAECADGKVAPGVVGPNPEFKPREVTLRHSRVARLLGSEILDKDIVRILASLGLEEVKNPAKKTGKKMKKKAAAAGAVTTWRVPSWRQELGIEVDLIEEIARVYGYNRLPGKPTMRVIPVRPNPIFEARRQIRGLLTGLGYTEVVGASFLPNDWGIFGTSSTGLQPTGFAEAFGMGGHRLRNPARSGEGTLRTRLLPSLVAAKLANENAGKRRARLFDVAPVCLPGHEVAVERLAIIDDGVEGEDTGEEDALLRAKGTIEAIAELGNRAGDVQFEPVWYQLFWLFRVNEIRVAGRVIGLAGTLGARVKSRPSVVEMDLAPFDFSRVPRFAEFSRLPAIARDVALIVDESRTWAEIQEKTSAVTHEWRSAPRFLSLYRGKQIGEGRKSIAFRVVYQAPDRTLTDEDVKGPHEEFVRKLCEALGATLRQ